jgi:hypothetical protein
MILGGVLPANFLVDPGAEVDIYGKSFLLNNQPLAGLEQPGDSLLLSARGGQTLNVVLADGSLLEWRLTSPISPRLPFGFSNQAILRLHLVPEPAAVGLLFQVLGLMLLGVRQRGTAQVHQERQNSR